MKVRYFPLWDDVVLKRQLLHLYGTSTVMKLLICVSDDEIGGAQLGGRNEILEQTDAFPFVHILPFLFFFASFVILLDIQLLQAVV